VKVYQHSDPEAYFGDPRPPIIYLFRLPGITEPFRVAVEHPVTVSADRAAVEIEKWTLHGWFTVGYIDGGRFPAGASQYDCLQIAQAMIADLFGPETEACGGLRRKP
jgi:hypothetical protein